MARGLKGRHGPKPDSRGPMFQSTHDVYRLETAYETASGYNFVTYNVNILQSYQLTNTPV